MKVVTLINFIALLNCVAWALPTVEQQQQQQPQETTSNQTVAKHIQTLQDKAVDQTGGVPATTTEIPARHRLKDDGLDFVGQTEIVLQYSRQIVVNITSPQGIMKDPDYYKYFVEHVDKKNVHTSRTVVSEKDWYDDTNTTHVYVINDIEKKTWKMDWDNGTVDYKTE